MTTKLVVTVDGLLLTDQNTVVSSRSIDEVVLVNTVSGFNALTETQRSNIISRKTNNIGSATLSVAFASETSGTLNDDFYNWLSTNNISFVNDPDLTSFSTSEILTSNGSETFTSISESNIQSFDTSELTNNSLYTAGGSLALGSTFGDKPSISLLTPTFLDDLSGSISVTITASQFSNILSSSYTGDKISIDSITPNVGGVFVEINYADVEAGFNGSNRLGNTSGVANNHSTVGSSGGNYFWGSESSTDAVEINVSQALMLPLMGVAPRFVSVALKDTAANLAVGMKAFSVGQMSSFTDVVITDDQVLTLDVATFKSLDIADQSSSFQSCFMGCN